MNKETKKAAQDAYHEARSIGHTKEEARQIRDNWKPSKRTISISDDDDDDYYIDDEVDPDFDDYDY